MFGGYEPERPATLEEDSPQPPSPKGKTPPKRRKSGLHNVIALLFIGGAIGMVALMVLVAQNPNLPFNPFPPLTVAPTPTLFVFDGGAGASSGSPAPVTRIPTQPPLSSGATTPTAAITPTGLTAPA